jgi:hypothetical protein
MTARDQLMPRMLRVLSRDGSGLIVVTAVHLLGW